MDYKNLYKNKYIYYIYESSDRKIHLEKYPIIYMNKEYVYYKQTNSDLLNYQSFRFIKNEYDLPNVSKYYKGYYKFFIGIKEKDLKELVEKLKIQMEINYNHEKEKQAMSRLERAKHDYENALKEVELFNKLKRKLKEKQDADSKNQEA